MALVAAVATLLAGLTASTAVAGEPAADDTATLRVQGTATADRTFDAYRVGGLTGTGTVTGDPTLTTVASQAAAQAGVDAGDDPVGAVWRSDRTRMDAFAKALANSLYRDGTVTPEASLTGAGTLGVPAGAYLVTDTDDPDRAMLTLAPGTVVFDKTDAKPGRTDAPDGSALGSGTVSSDAVVDPKGARPPRARTGWTRKAGWTRRPTGVSWGPAS